MRLELLLLVTLLRLLDSLLWLLLELLLRVLLELLRLVALALVQLRVLVGVLELLFVLTLVGVKLLWLLVLLLRLV